MVHRIHNRNPGYSDFSQVNTSTAYNLSNQLGSTAVDGANALKIDNEVVTDASSETNSSQSLEELIVQTQEVVLENNEEKTDSLKLENEIKEEKESNGLENFEIEDETPELFNSEENLETEENNQEFSSFSNHDEEKNEEDELDIPAFLRRQKN